MGIEPIINFKAIDKMLYEFHAVVQENVVRILSFIGEKCVNEAKVAGAYNDRTGNLRASSGYIVIHDGNIFNQNFQSGTGGAKAMQLANEIVSQYPKGSALIVVAGMKYAAYVEAKGLNVLTSAELIAEREIPNLLKQLSR